MNLDESPILDSVPFEFAQSIWVHNGVLPVSLSGANFGGTLSLLYEARSISEMLGVPRVLLTADRAQPWLESLAKKFNYSNVAQYPSYPANLDGLNEFHAHSTLRLLRHPELVSGRSQQSIWCDTVIEETAVFLESIVRGESVLFATKFQEGQRRPGDFPLEHWIPILQRLSETHKVLILGSNPSRESFANLGVVFLTDLLSLPAQVELVSSQTIPLVGDASGFFSAAIWHRGAYLCFKDPNYDVTEMNEEHAGDDHLHVATGFQYLIREQPNLEAVRDFLRRASNGQ